jgi:hypothetical protein
MSSDYELEYVEPVAEPRRSGSSGKALLIVLAIVGGLGLVCAGVVVVGFAAIITLGQNASGTFNSVATKVDGPPADPTFTRVANRVESGNPDRVVEQFLEYLRADRSAAAYDLTSRRFQTSVNYQAFVNQTRGIPAFQPLKGAELRGQKSTGPNRVTISITPQGLPKVELLLVTEDGVWKIDDFIPS